MGGKKHAVRIQAMMSNGSRAGGYGRDSNVLEQCDEETFKQIKFLIDVVKNKRIIQLFDEIILLRDKY